MGATVVEPVGVTGSGRGDGERALWSWPGEPFPGLVGVPADGLRRSTPDSATHVSSPVEIVASLADVLADEMAGARPTGRFSSSRPASTVPVSGDLVVVPDHRRRPIGGRVDRSRQQLLDNIPGDGRHRALVALSAAVVLIALSVGMLDVFGASSSSPVGAASSRGDAGVASHPDAAGGDARSAGSASPEVPTEHAVAPKSSLPTTALQLPPASSVLPVPATPVNPSASTTPTDTSAAPLITTAEAQLVADGLWARRLAALASGDGAALAGIDSGAALASDTAVLDAGARAVPPGSGAPQVVVPVQTAYPLEFSGSVVEGDDTALAAFFRASASTSWTISLVTTFPTASPPVAEATRLPLSLASLASAWQQWATLGTAPSAASAAFLPEDAYQSIGQQVAEQAGLAAMRGLEERATFVPDASPGASLTDGTLGLTCGAIQQTVVLTPKPGGTITQPASRATWGASVSPGQYRSVTQLAVYQVCLGGSVSGTVVLSGSGGTYSTVATAP